MTDPQHDERMERSLRVWLTEGRSPLADRDAQIDRVLRHLDEAPQARRRFLGRWLDRDQGARRRTDRHDHSPDTNRRNRLMFSATGLVAAFAILAISVNVVNTTDTSPPNAGAGTQFSVAADGSGDFSTIGEAVAAAVDGDTIMVRPGTYTEAIVIDKDITLMGDGLVDEIVITAPADGPTTMTGSGPAGSGPEPYAVLLEDSQGTLSGLTFKGESAAVIASGGAPVLTGLVIDEVNLPYRGGGGAAGNSIVINGGSTATVQGNTITDGGPIGVFDLSEPLIEGNTLSGGPHIWGGYGDGAIIRGNTIDGSLVRGIYFDSPSSPLIEDNVITDPGPDGLTLRSGAPTVRDNVISGATIAGISVTYGEATLEGNEFSGNRIAIQIGRADPIVTGNRVEDGAAGIVVVSGGAPTITDNTIDVTGRGIAIGKGTNPVVHGNDVCGGEVSIHVADGAEPQLGDNQTCEGAVTE